SHTTLWNTKALQDCAALADRSLLPIVMCRASRLHGGRAGPSGRRRDYRAILPGGVDHYISSHCAVYAYDLRILLDGLSPKTSGNMVSLYMSSSLTSRLSPETSSFRNNSTAV